MTWIYRVALRLLSAETRERHGPQMADVFAQVLRDARRCHGRLAAVRTALAELLSLAQFAWSDRQGRRGPRRIDERGFAWTDTSYRSQSMLSSIAQDVRYALRALGHAPAFTSIAIATIALAVGANTAIFSVVNGVLLKPLAFPDAERLVTVGLYSDGSRQIGSTSPGNFYDWQESVTTFEALAGWATTARNLSGPLSAERVTGVGGTGRLFDVLRSAPLLGRTFTLADDEPSASRVIVLSYGLWQRLYAGDPSVIGRVLTLGGDPYTVIGVMPVDFRFADGSAEYWIPWRFDPAFRANRDQFFLLAVGRLGTDVDIQAARVELGTVMDRIRLAHPQATESSTIAVEPMKELLVDGVRTRLLTLMGAVSFILLIACANLGNLLLARAAGRRREVAVRHALGARPARVVRQLLTESIVLALAGGIAGVVLAHVLLGALVALLPPDLPRAENVRLDATVLAFTFIVSCVTGLLFGAFPALHLAKGDPADAIRDGSRGSARGQWVRSTLVVSEVALALVLLTGAGLLIRSFSALLDVDLGIRATNLLTFRVGVTPATYDTPAKRQAFFNRTMETLRALPGVSDVAMISDLPVGGRGTGAWFNIIAKPLPPSITPPSVPWRVAAWDALQTLGLPLRRGRYFTPDDRQGGMRAVIISESVARKFWPAEDPIGQRIYLGAPDNRIVDDAEIVGVVGDVKQAGLDEATSEAVYLPHGLVPSMTTLSFALRTTLTPASLASAAREQLRQIDPTAAMFRVQTMDTMIEQSLRPTRSSMLLIGVLAAVALVLALLGVFGVLSYTVTLRATELGIRMALGAGGSRIALLMLGHGMLPVVIGVVIGVAAALAVTRFMASLLFGVSPTDPLTFAAVAALIVLVAGIASYLPARRAARVDPVAVLRQA